MLTTLAAAICLAQVPTSTSTHVEIQKFKWEQAQKLDNVQLDFTIQMSGEDDETTNVWRIWKSGKSSNFESLSDGKVMFQLSIDPLQSILVDHVNKSYYATPIDAPGAGPKTFELPTAADQQLEFKFDGLWFYINASEPLQVKSVSEEKLDGRSLVCAAYVAKSDKGYANIKEWIEPKTGLVYRFSIRIRSEESGVQTIDGWLSHLELNTTTSFLDRMFVPSAHTDYTKVDN
jgi:hypothetical protein